MISWSQSDLKRRHGEQYGFNCPDCGYWVYVDGIPYVVREKLEAQ